MSAVLCRSARVVGEQQLHGLQRDLRVPMARQLVQAVDQHGGVRPVALEKQGTEAGAARGPPAGVAALAFLEWTSYTHAVLSLLISQPPRPLGDQASWPTGHPRLPAESPGLQ